MASWMKDLQERVRRASSEVNTALQPRVAQAKRSLEESIEQMGLKRGRDIYDSDPELLAAIARLDSLRTMLKSVAETVEAHKKNIIACAQTQKKLGEALSVPDSSAVTLFENHVSSDRVAAQIAFGAAQLAASNAMSRFALDMSTPMADLSRTFEETYVAKISPLKKKYAAQKTEYFKYLRQAAAADDEAMRYNLEAVAQNARPVWERSSEELRGEIQSLVSHTLSSMSEWSLNVAQAEAEAYSRSVRAFEGPAKQAETAQNAPPAV